MTSSDFTLTAKPLPMMPPRTASTPEFLHTLDSNPHLFDIVTPLKVDAFHSYTASHPNCPFVDSVLHSLYYGFWPYASPPVNFPSIVDQSKDNSHLLQDEAKREFFDKECHKELDLQHFSQSFPRLLPGMACMLSYMVKHGDKYCLVTDHSSEPHSLNSLISKEDHAVPLCGLQQFGYMLHKAWSESSTPIVIFKSDMSQAYWMVPMSPYWQMLQAVKLSNGQYAINHNNVFGGAASGHCWWSVMVLVLWIAKEHFGCTNILDYIDDAYSWEYV